MKTTIELSDQLFRRAKAAVARRGMTLKEFFTRAAERELARIEHGEPAAEATPGWHRLLQKPTSAELKELERVDEVIESEFSSVDSDSWR
jgi:hypothetical protein